jgi:hypothetical protein
MRLQIVSDRALHTIRPIPQYLTGTKIKLCELYPGADKCQELRRSAIEIPFREAYPQDRVASCLADQVLAGARSVVDRPRRCAPPQERRRRIEHDRDKIK